MEGTVRVGGRPADSGTVVLHRVGPDFTGEVDSVSVASDGRFRILLPADVPQEGSQAGSEVFFASIRYGGILYFGSALRSAEEVDSAYVIQAYPSELVSPETAVLVRVRNLFIEASDSGWSVTDLFEVSNPGLTTLVAPAGQDSWSHRLPRGATDFQVGQSDLSPDVTRFEGGRLATSGPIPPEESVYLVSYRVTEESIVIPSDTPTESFELLVREPGPELSVTGLAQMDPVEVDGTTYRRFAGAGLPAMVIQVVPGSRWNPSTAIPWLGAMLAVLLSAFGAYLTVRRRRPTGRKRILMEIARLDERQAAGRLDPEDYELERAGLVRELVPQQAPEE